MLLYKLLKLCLRVPPVLALRIVRAVCDLLRSNGRSFRLTWALAAPLRSGSSELSPETPPSSLLPNLTSEICATPLRSSCAALPLAPLPLTAPRRFSTRWRCVNPVTTVGDGGGGVAGGESENESPCQASACAT